MDYAFAPLEGLTDCIYRTLHHKYFPGIDRYYTPFFSPTSARTLTPREARELPPADTLGVAVIPQLLTKHPEDFLWMCEKLQDLGYTQVNLNTGCPSGTVCSKEKGAGMLKNMDFLAGFLDEIFTHAPVGISIKTRIGFDLPDEFPALLEIFNRYPVKELIIHPRVRNAFYKGSVDLDTFAYAYQNCKAPVCYNGSLNSLENIQEISDRFPNVSGIMVGRALIADPGMLSPKGTTADALEAFYGELLEQYLEAFGGSRNAMFRLKENWQYLICKFEGGEKLAKRLRKTTDLQEYKAITREIFHNLPIKKELTPTW